MMSAYAGANERPAATQKQTTIASRAAATAAADSGARAARGKGRKPATAPSWSKPVLASEQFAQAVSDGVVFAKMARFNHWPAQVCNTLWHCAMVSVMCSGHAMLEIVLKSLLCQFSTKHGSQILEI